MNNHKDFYISHLDINSQMLILLNTIDFKDKKKIQQFIDHTDRAVNQNYMYYILALIYRY
ncbi:hypothetical protein UES1_223 [Escherichia phage UE-S1]|nr:hypothetical protein UES1_223 [Escherichia phage UE-S1]